MLSVILENELISAFESRLALIRPPSGRVGIQGVTGGALFQELKAHLPQAEQMASLQAAETGSFDLLLAPFVFCLYPDPKTLLSEWRRVLRPQGILMLTALGPDTLTEFPQIPPQATLIDMHDLGDAMVAAGFQEPVLDVEQLLLVYRDEKKYREEMHLSGLMKAGTQYPLPARDAEGRLSLSIELIYAHAFSAAVRPGEISVPVSAIERRF